MNLKNILSLILSLVLSLIISGVVYWFLFLEVWDLFGTDELTKPESRDGTIFYTTLTLTIFTGIIVFFLIQLKKKYLAIGFGLPAIIGLTLLIWIGPTYLNKSSYYEEFDKGKWMTKKEDRIKMAREMVKNRELLGLTKEEVIERLGGEYIIHYGEMSYTIYGGFCGLSIMFEDNKVSNYGIWVRD